MKLNDVMSLALCALALEVPLAGCGATILGGGDGTSPQDDSGGTDTDTETSIDAPGPPDSAGNAVTAIAILSQDVPAPPSGSNPSEVGFAGATGSLALVFAGDWGLSCSSPYIPNPPAETAWEGVVVLPANLLQPGTIDLASDGASTFDYVFYPASVGGGGGGGGGPAQSGTLRIVSIDATSITVNLITPLPISPAAPTSITVQGTYVIPRC